MSKTKPPKRNAAKAKPVPPPQPVAGAPAPVASPPAVKPGRGQPPHVPTRGDRDTVSVMVAGGIALEDIARARSISVPTLRKHYKPEITTGATAINTIVIIEHMKRIKAGDFNAIKWWQQSRMGWSERIIVDDGKPADTPMRVIVELVGEAASPQAERSAPRSGSRLPDEIRKNVKLVG